MASCCGHSTRSNLKYWILPTILTAKEPEGDWSPGDCSCFPSNGKVITRHGRVSIRDIKPRDEVLAMNAKGELLFSEVWVITHDDPEATMRVVSLTTESGTKLRLSHGHYLPIRSQDGATTFTLAGQIKVDDLVLTGCQADKMAAPERVVAVEEEEALGRHALLTLEGTQVVDGLVASCFEEHAHPSLAQPLLAPLRLAYRGLPLATDLLNYKWSQGVPAWALLAKQYVAPFLPRLA